MAESYTGHVLKCMQIALSRLKKMVISGIIKVLNKLKQVTRGRNISFLTDVYVLCESSYTFSL